jgi:hypothetical protein
MFLFLSLITFFYKIREQEGRTLSAQGVGDGTVGGRRWWGGGGGRITMV